MMTSAKNARPSFFRSDDLRDGMPDDCEPVDETQRSDDRRRFGRLPAEEEGGDEPDDA